MQTFFTDPRLLEFLELLITKYLRLSSQDLEMWQSEPEEWVLEEESEIWESHTKVGWTMVSYHIFEARLLKFV